MHLLFFILNIFREINAVCKLIIPLPHSCIIDTQEQGVCGQTNI